MCHIYDLLRRARLDDDDDDPEGYGLGVSACFDAMCALGGVGSGADEGLHALAAAAGVSWEATLEGDAEVRKEGRGASSGGSFFVSSPHDDATVVTALEGDAEVRKDMAARARARCCERGGGGGCPPAEVVLVYVVVPSRWWNARAPASGLPRNPLPPVAT